jgi:hypothetical protein
MKKAIVLLLLISSLSTYAGTLSCSLIKSEEIDVRAGVNTGLKITVDKKQKEVETKLGSDAKMSIQLDNIKGVATISRDGNISRLELIDSSKNTKAFVFPGANNRMLNVALESDLSTYSLICFNK